MCSDTLSLLNVYLVRRLFIAGMLLTGSFGAAALQDPSITSQQTDTDKASSTGAAIPASFVAPPAHAEVGNIVIDIAVGDTAMNDLGSVAYRDIFQVGLASIPLSLLNPTYAAGVLYPVFVAPLNAAYNSKRKTILHILAEEPLATVVLEALQDQLPASHAPYPLHLNLSIDGYGLEAKSAKDIEEIDQVMLTGEDLCLTAYSRLTISSRDNPVREAQLNVALTGHADNAPPPVCASLTRFSQDDGIYLRQSIQELAEILAAMTLNRLEVMP
jgi:hypothetical protein